MTSGNFLIGSGLSLEGFTQYIQPFFEEKGYSVQDKLDVPHKVKYGRRAILVSVVGEGDLEKDINETLVESGQVILKTEEERRRGNRDYKQIAHPIEVTKERRELQDDKFVFIPEGKYQTIGMYQADNTASELFPSLAKGYLLEGLETKAKEVTQEVEDQIKDLGKRLSDL